MPHSTLPCQAIVMDVEGTTSAARFVYDVLFPYARERMGDWLAQHRSDPEVAAAIADVASELQCSPDDLAAVTAQLVAWIDDDVKAAPLKSLQGRIWAEGYAQGAITSHFFDDVEPALRAWKQQGLRLAVYSSGSIAAQQSLFQHAPNGSLDALIDANFDITTAGPKREAESYRRIAEALGLEPQAIVFLSDIEAELAAAREAGWQAVGVARPGEAQATAAGPGTIAGFAELVVEPSR